ncbi:MAG: hypothetical protein D4R64_03235 [Porphyromonadaceae bacterium]|nr:MAG: hypothetical protein D4R64_03235 [Porphyromonadaceae bacterium]
MILISVPFVLLLGSGLLAIFLFIHTWIPTIISGILVILGWSITVILKLLSVKFHFSDDTISVLYYPISPMTSNFKRIDIASYKFLKYQIKTSLLGLRKDLILYESIGGEAASYPPVTITLCGKETIRKIEEYLSAYCSNGK